MLNEQVELEEGIRRLPIAHHGAFFRDPTFSSSWSLIQKLQRDYEKAHHLKEAYRLSKAAEEDGGLPVRPNIIQSPDTNDEQPSYYPVKLAEGGKNDYYEVILDVHHFRPNEIIVKKRDAGPLESELPALLIEGQHSEGGRHDPVHAGYIARQFKRTYNLPPDAETHGMKVCMSADGILLIIIPRNTTNPPNWTPQITTKATCNGNGVVLDNDEADGGEGEDAGFLNKWKTGFVDQLTHVLPDFHLKPIWHRLTDWTTTTANNLVEPHGHEAKFGLQSDNENFKVVIDVSGFTPEELQVRYNEQVVVIEAAHQAKKDDFGSVSRAFTGRYDLPKSIGIGDEIKLVANLCPGGILEIKAPKLVLGKDDQQQKWNELPINIINSTE